MNGLTEEQVAEIITQRNALEIEVSRLKGVEQEAREFIRIADDVNKGITSQWDGVTAYKAFKSALAGGGGSNG